MAVKQSHQNEWAELTVVCRQRLKQRLLDLLASAKSLGQMFPTCETKTTIFKTLNTGVMPAGHSIPTETTAMGTRKRLSR